jgi:hypothetical protein
VICGSKRYEYGTEVEVYESMDGRMVAYNTVATCRFNSLLPAISFKCDEEIIKNQYRLVAPLMSMKKV